jgi:putative RecB family exonuclease
VFARTVWDASGWQKQVEELSEPLGSVNEFKRSALGCIENLFALENPQHTEFDGVEHNVTASIEGVEMRGIIDRFMFSDDGIVISDYKTGKVPNPRFTSEDEKVFQLLAYALMLKESEDEDTSKVQLLYLAQPVVHELEVTPVKLSIAKGTIVETKEAIDASCAAGEFHCNVTKLCNWCFYKTSGHCPAFAGRG